MTSKRKRQKGVTKREIEETGLPWRDLRPSWDRDKPDPNLGELKDLKAKIEQERRERQR